MSKFEGCIRDLGDLPRKMLRAVLGKLRSNGHLWTTNDPRFVASHPGSQHIVFKFPEHYPESHLQASYTPLWRDWAESLTPIIDSVRNLYGFTFSGTSKVMLSKLKAHAQVPPHVDSNPSSLVPHKVHVPLITSADVIFFVDGVRYHLEYGKAYEINNLLLHSVENNSNIDRVHLVFELYPTEVAASETSA